MIPSRVCAAAGVYGNIWEYIMEGAFARCARARAIRSAAHSTARWVPPTRMRVEADARRGRRSMGRTSRVNRTVTEPTGSTGVPASSILFSQPRRHAPAPGQCSELDACATARTADAKSPHFPRQEVRVAAQSGVSTRWRAASALKNENVMTQQRLAFDALNSEPFFWQFLNCLLIECRVSENEAGKKARDGEFWQIPINRVRAIGLSMKSRRQGSSGQ